MLSVDHKVVDEYHCHGMIMEVKAKVESLLANFNKDHKRLEDMIGEVRKHNEDQDERAQRMKEKMNKLEMQTSTCLSALTENTQERKTLNEKLTSFSNDLALIKRDMERSADTKKHTVQHIMSIVGPVVTAALILWLGLS